MLYKKDKYVLRYLIFYLVLDYYFDFWFFSLVYTMRIIALRYMYFDFRTA